MKCLFVQVGQTTSGFLYRCSACNYTTESRYADPLLVRRVCPVLTTKEERKAVRILSVITDLPYTQDRQQEISTRPEVTDDTSGIQQVFEFVYGPGSELKRLLRRLGITARSCKCNERARLMNEMGADWCEEHLEDITRWLEEEAKKRKLPFVRLAGRILVRWAIRNSRKKAKLA